MDGSCVSASFNEIDGICRLSQYGDHELTRLIDGSPWVAVSKKVNFDDWTQIGDAYYIFFEEGKTYTEAQIHCEEFGGKLAEPPTYDAFEMLRTYMVEHLGRNSYWIGLNDADGDGVYLWASNDTIPSYTAWSSDLDPSTFAGYCVYVAGSNDFKWSNGHCSDYIFSVCEKVSLPK